jgi:hypothetical protein
MEVASKIRITARPWCRISAALSGHWQVRVHAILLADLIHNNPKDFFGMGVIAPLPPDLASRLDALLSEAGR